jgi:hypothetical protein
MAANVRVFISHKQEDAVVATRIGAELRSNGVDAYLDTIDTQLGKDGPDLADYIRDQLAQCTQLLAVISPRTKLSWWVPWEIGVATEKERPQASYIADEAEIPSYLIKWPYLRSMAEVTAYAEVSKRVRDRLDESVRMRRSTASVAQTSAFRDFHRTLKARLGQT